MDAYFFWFFTALMLAGAAVVVVNRNPVAAVLSLVFLVLLPMAGLFCLLHAFFLAVILAIVYAGAVMVLFLFVIMLLDLKAEEHRRLRPLGAVAGGGLALFLGWQLARVLNHTEEARLPMIALPPPAADDVKALGTLLFTKYVLPFEAIGVLLLVAMVGVVLLSKKDLR